MCNTKENCYEDVLFPNNCWTIEKIQFKLLKKKVKKVQIVGDDDIVCDGINWMPQLQTST